MGTSGSAVFTGDNAAHIVQANYIKENPDQIFGWSEISFAGYPLLLFYQPIPHLLLAVLFNLGNIFLTYRILLVLLFTLIPISFFYSIKRIGFRNIESLAASMLPLLISSFTGYGLEPASIFGWGLFTQLIGIVLFPVVISQLYCSIQEHKSKTLSVFLLSTILLIHSIIGFSCLVIGLLITILDFADFKKRISYYIRIVFYSFICISFWAVPLLMYTRLYGGILKSAEFMYSFGLLKIISKLLTGGIMDAFRHIPIITAFAIAGVFFIVYIFFRNLSFKLPFVWKNDCGKKERFVFYGLISGFILFSGGKLIQGIPILSFFELHRFIFIFHFFLILAISIFIGFLYGKFGNIVFILLVLSLVPVLTMSYYTIYQRQEQINGNSNIDDVNDIALYLKPFPDGRVYLHSPVFEPSQALFYYYSKKPLLMGFSLGSQDSLSTKHIMDLKLTDANLRRYNIKYIVINSSVELSYPKEVFGNWTVYFVNTSGYFKLDEECGILLDEKKDSEYQVHLYLQRECSMLFKMTYSPFWNAYSMGHQLNISRTNDSLINIDLKKNMIEIKLQYEDTRYRKYLLIISIITFLGLIIKENLHGLKKRGK